MKRSNITFGGILLISLCSLLYLSAEPPPESPAQSAIDRFTKPLKVPPGKLYSFEELDKHALEKLAQVRKDADRIKARKERREKAKKKTKQPTPPISVTANNESFLCKIGHSVKYNVLSNDLPKEAHLVISKITRQPAMGKVRIDGPNIIYTETARKIGIDTFYYEVLNSGTGKTATGRVRVLVTFDWKNGKYNTGNDPSAFVPPSPRFNNKQERNIFAFFQVGVKPIKGLLNGEEFMPEMAFPFATKGKNGRDTLPAGYIWNYPYDKYFAKGDPVLTAGIGFSDLRIHSKYIRKYMFKLDIENYTLSSKNHWRAFQKWGKIPDADRATWTGDVGFTLEDKNYHPSSLVRGRFKPYAYYKLTTYEGITGYFTDRRKPEQIKAGAPWEVIRVSIPLQSTLPASGGRMKFEFDFWPFLKFMIDHKGWSAGYPLGGPIGNEVYNNPGLSSADNRPAGEVVVRNISHWIKSDLPPQKTIKPITLTSGKSANINLGDIFTLPMMRLPTMGEPETHKWPPFHPKFKIKTNSDKAALNAAIKGDQLILKAGSSKGSVLLTIRCYDTFHEWYDDKTFTVTVH